MPTIKDVAKLAGVSHGTVSNIINGSKSVNSEIVKRVEKAIKELGYQPNVKARSLRNSKTSCIGVVIPNIIDNIYKNIYSGIEIVARESGYSISLYITNDSPETEKKQLSRMQQQRVDGALIITSMPESNATFQRLQKSGIKMVFVRRKPTDMENFIFLGVDEKQALFDMTSKLINDGINTIALLMGKRTYSNERECLEGYCDALASCGKSIDETLIKCSHEGKESAFRVTTWWFKNINVPKAIISTCPEYVKGVLAAVQMFKRDESPIIATMDSESWIHNLMASPISRMVQNYTKLGEKAAQKLLKTIENNGEDQGVSIVLKKQTALHPVQYNERKQSKSRIKSNATLRLLLFDSASSIASSLMKSVFTEQTGIQVNIDMVPYERMYQSIIGDVNKKQYDIVQINVPWLSEMIRKGVIIELDRYLPKQSDVCGMFSEEVLQRHGVYNGLLYALPYVFGTQLLFYRKDLFNDLRIQRLYYEKYKSSMEVPNSWKEYDRIAKFFTKEFNTESPVPYGTTQGVRGSIYYYTLRLWEAGVRMFNTDNSMNMDSERAKDILTEYCRAFRFADPKAKEWNQSQQAVEFCQGNASMMVIYQAHFADYVYKYEPTIGKENIGFAKVPGKVSILGGWSLAVRSDSKMKDEAIEYLKWNYTENSIIPHNILGGAIPSRTVVESSEMISTYPWLPQAFDGFKDTQSMINTNIEWLSQWQFEVLADQILRECINSSIAPEIALSNLYNELRTLKSIFYENT